jgi:transposase InsO family protein
MEKIYYDPRHPASLGGVNRLQQATRDIETKKWLASQRVYSLHKPIRRKFPTRRTRTSHFAAQYQADLNDMIAYSSVNKGFQYILTVVDVFSRYAWAQPLKQKTGKNLVAAFKKIFSTAPAPNYLQTDRGKEFENSVFQSFLRSHNVTFFTVTSQVKASLVERFNRTLKTRMFRYFTHQGSYKWVDVLPHLIKSYNSSEHRSLPKGMTPMAAALPHNHERVWTHQEKSSSRQRKLFSVGDEVRISKHKGTFEKGYLPNWSEEIFTIAKIDERFHPPMYVITDEQGEEVKGKFYAPELQKVSNPEKLYAIEKIIRRRKNGEGLVKFLGYPGHYWVKDIQKI